ncbi:MAG: GNAT family N-acetyltransferase [Planctomycetes bacterium]|nr:GNAT family N-acetyltransferase [Planctomycetota bacterium]
MIEFMESKRLWYRAPEIADAEIIGKYINDERVRGHLSVTQFPLGLEAEREFLRSHSAAAPFVARTDVVFVFGLKKSPPDKVIGSTGLHQINWLVRSAEWGIVIGDPKQWNKGLGREIAARMLEYAFVGLNLNRVHLRVDADNVGGIKCYEAAGFQLEGRQRQNAIGPSGITDMLLMAVLREDWGKTR